MVRIVLGAIPMRAHALLLLLLASGCSLYFRPQSDDGPTEWPPDVFVPDARESRPDAFVPDANDFPSGASMVRCEDSQLYVATAATFPDPPGHGGGRAIGRCEGPCRSAAAFCASADCKDAIHTVCAAPISLGATCPLEGTACQGSEAIGCPESTACSVPVAGSTCACAGGTYHCSQLTPAASTQAALVGKWRGMATTPGFGETPYPVSLWIYPDGTYWPDCPDPHCSAFYYGGDGPSPRRKITILSTSPSTGSWADIAIDFGNDPPNTGTVTALVVDATTLRFTFSASWFSCGQPFDFNLTRVD
jgi:hypothetical protein